MSLTILKFMLVLGIIGHAINMYCDRILCVFPNGMLRLEDLKDVEHNDKLEKLMEGVPAGVADSVISCASHFLYVDKGMAP